MLGPGSTLAGYRIDRILGRGGMGVVYAATQLSLERTVALKVMAAELSGDAEFSERFRREGRVQAALEHPHIITVYEAGESDEGLFIAMRLVRGPNLKDLIVARELDATRALTILTQVADALDTAHAAGLVHRDIKPQNVLVSVGSRDHAYLADFGVTKAAGRTGLTRTGALVGTLDYMPPEQIEGHPATSKSDIYSFGAVLFECLTGVIPYAKNSDAAVLYAHLSEPPPKPTEERPDLPEALDAVLARAMAKKPEERYGTATEMMIDVDAAFGGRAAAVAVAPGPIARPEEIGVRRAERAVSTPSARSEPTTPGASRLEPTTPARARVVAPASPSTAADVGVRRRSSLWPAVAFGAVALALAGFFGGRALGGGSSTGTSLESADVSIAQPAGWAAAPAPAIPGLAFGDAAVSLAPAGSRDGLVAGRRAAGYPSYLPPSFVARLGSDPTSSRDVVDLGALQAYRYARLRPKGYDRVLTLYAVPQAGGHAVVLACYATDAAAHNVEACARSATSLRTRRGTNLSIVSPRSYAVAVKAAVSRLGTSRSAQLGRLRRARTRAAQARAARSTASAYRAAATGLGAAAASPIARPAQASAVSLLRAAAAAYERLGAAASRGDAAAYRTATRQIARTEARLRRELETLTAVVLARR